MEKLLQIPWSSWRRPARCEARSGDVTAVPARSAHPRARHKLVISPGTHWDYI